MHKKKSRLQTLPQFFQAIHEQRSGTLAGTSTSESDHLPADPLGQISQLPSSSTAALPFLTYQPTTDAPQRLMEPRIAEAEGPQQGELGNRQVVLPWSPANRYVGANGATCHRWDLILHVLTESGETTSNDQLLDLMQSLNRITNGDELPFSALMQAMEAMLPCERLFFFTSVLPWMKATVRSGPDIFRERTVPLLIQGEAKRLMLSHLETTVLMCCAFFSLFPKRSDRCVSSAPLPSQPRSEPRVSRKLSAVNFSSLFCSTAKPTERRYGAVVQKTRSVLHYFCCAAQHCNDDVTAPAQLHCLEFTRAVLQDDMDFTKSVAPLTPVTMCYDGGIEQDRSALQVDFANRFIGGGVLRTGCVQEEMRMMISPELLLSRLVCEEMMPNEAIFMSGAATMCCVDGYGDTFRFVRGMDPWASDTNSEEPLIPTPFTNPCTNQLMHLHSVCIVAIDAFNFRAHGLIQQQFQKNFLQRELCKSFVAFRGIDPSYAILTASRQGSIATGHWGCGAFGGCHEWKCLIQWCAAAAAGRTLHYYTFGTPLPHFEALQGALVGAKWTVGRLVAALSSYDSYLKSASSEMCSPAQYVQKYELL